MVILVFGCALALGLASVTQSAVPKAPRVIGGNNAMAGQFPSSAAIHVTTSQGRFFCGGTLIDQEWIITAGQCVDGATLFTIDIGSTSLTKTDTNRVTLSTSDYVLHPDYNPETLENDIGLIRLRLPVQYSNYIQPIGGLSEAEINTTTKAVVIGWGQTSDSNSDLSDILQFVPVIALTNEECKLIFGTQITEDMVCVEGNYNEGACTGDTGSGLIEVILAGQSQLVGISSFISFNGCESTDPSGYTRISPYITWIQETISA